MTASSPRTMRGQQGRAGRFVGVGLQGGSGGAVLQQRHPGQYPPRFAQDEAEGDGVQSGAAVTGSGKEAEEVGSGQFPPQRAVEVLGDRAPNRFGGCLLFLGEGEVH